MQRDDIQTGGAQGAPLPVSDALRGAEAVTIRPSFARYRKIGHLGTALAIGFVLVAYQFFIRTFLAHSWTAWQVVAGICGIFGLFALYLELYFQNARIFGDAGSFGKVGAFGRRRAWPRGVLSQVLICQLDGGYGPRRRCLFISKDGRLLVDVLADIIDTHQAKRLAELQGASYSERQYPMMRSELLDEFPNLFPWPLRHMTITTIVGCIVLIAAIIVSAVLIHGSH